MPEKLFEFGRRFADIYLNQRLPQAAAALSYYFTMTIFPLLVVLYTLLGNNYEDAMRLLSVADKFLAADTAEYIRQFIQYVALHNSKTMMIAGVSVLITTASSAVRALTKTIGIMQGGARYYGLKAIPFSVIFSFIFTAVIYLSMLILLTGRTFFNSMIELMPFLEGYLPWNYIRFFVLGIIVFAMFWIVYSFSRRIGEHYMTVPGAALATVGMIAVSLSFSVFLSASARYPLIYGSIASVILLMFWLYASSLVLYCGAAFNIVLRDMKAEAEE